MLNGSAEAESPDLADARTLLATACKMQETTGDTEASLPLTLQAFTLLAGAVTSDTSVVALGVEALRLEARARAHRKTSSEIAAADRLIIAAFDRCGRLDPGDPTTRLLTGLLWRDRGFVAWYQSAKGGMTKSRAAFGEAVRTLRTIDPAVARHRDRLAMALLDYGLAMSWVGSMEGRRAAIAAYDEALSLFRTLDADASAYCNNLAEALIRKAFALTSIGSVAFQHDAIVACEEAVRLRRRLDQNVPHYCGELAAALASIGNVLRSFGNSAFLRDAIAAYDEAIRLRRTLDLDVPDHRKNLAGALNDRGVASLQAVGDAASIRHAIVVYDEAIRLYRGLDLDVPDHRDRLATTLSFKGDALRRLGGAETTRDAIAAYDEAIRLRRTLDLDVPDHRESLAGTLNDRGLALQALGDAASLRDAVSGYDEAIELRRALDLTVAYYRRNHASTLSNKGDVLRALGGPEALRDAIVVYDEAIRLYRGLDLDVPDHRNRLATTLSLKGDALRRLGGAETTRDAIVAYDEAIAFASELDIVLPEYLRTLVTAWGDRARAYWTLDEQDNSGDARAGFETAWNLLASVTDPSSSIDPPLGNAVLYIAFWYQQFLAAHQNWDIAMDIGDTALAVARALEAGGFGGERRNRELVFAATLAAYRHARSYRAIPEVIFEDLDPTAPGSACESAVMHKAATEILRDAIADLMASDSPGNGPVGLLLRAQQRMQTIATIAFAGTAQSARLRALAAAARGEMGQAEAILEHYVAARPRDPDGALVQAEWKLRLGRRADAASCLDLAGRLTVVRASDAPAAAVDRIAAITEALLYLRLQEWTETTFGADPRVALKRAFDSVQIWLRQELPQGLLADLTEAPAALWKELLDQRLAALWEQTAATRATSEAAVLKLRDPATLATSRTTAIKAALAPLERILDAAGPLPAWWQDVRDEALAARREATEIFRGLPADQANAAIADVLSNVAERTTEQLRPSELDEAMVQITTLLGKHLMDVLDQREQRYLAKALRLRDELDELMSIQLGKAMERALKRRLFEPVRSAVREQRLSLPAVSPEADAFTKRTYAILTSAGDKFLLGDLLGGFSGAMNRLINNEPPSFDVFGVLADRLRAAPNFPVLATPIVVWRRRENALKAVGTFRNASAHDRDDDAQMEDLHRIWNDTVEDGTVAFFQYFLAAFISNPPNINPVPTTSN